MKQQDMLAALEPLRPATPEPLFYAGLPDRSGEFAFTHLVRSPRDPKETRARGAEARETGVREAGWAGRTGSAEEWSARIVAHLSDGKPRTFNRICVELLGTTADVFFEKEPDQGLWLAVERGELLLTHETPIYFVHAQHVVSEAA